MQIATLKSYCNCNIDLRYELRADAPMTFILNGGYGILNLEEPVQIAFTDLLNKYHINWVQYLYPERISSNSFDDLYVSTGILALSEIYRWVKKQANSPVGLFGISYGAMISIEFALIEAVATLIIINAVFDYVDYRSKQLGEEAIEAWKSNFVTKLPYHNKLLPLGYRFVQETENQDLEKRAASVDCHVYAFQGDADPIIRPTHIKRLEKSTNNWHANIIKDADHVFDQKSSIDIFIREIEPVIKILSESRHAFGKHS